jgi:hypothetical protein
MLDPEATLSLRLSQGLITASSAIGILSAVRSDKRISFFARIHCTGVIVWLLRYQLAARKMTYRPGYKSLGLISEPISVQCQRSNQHPRMCVALGSGNQA